MRITFRNRDISIRGSDPFTTQQHIDALSQRNKAEYLERIGAAAPIIDEITQVKASTWKSMKGLFSSMENVVMMSSIGNLGSRLQQAALMPFAGVTNRINFMMEQVFTPLMPIVNQITRQYENFVMSYQTGSLIGGGIGLIAGAVLGHPLLGFLAGSTIGAGVEFLFNLFSGNLNTGDLSDPMYDPLYPEELFPDRYDSNNRPTPVRDPMSRDQRVAIIARARNEHNRRRV